MHHISFMFKIKPEHIPEYKHHHREIWPEMLDALRESGYRNYSLFMRESDGVVFGYYETSDPTASAEAIARHEVNHRWQQTMDPFFDTLEDGERVASMEQVFHLD